jgi:Kef-type K+ transport system membrane component KefB
MAEAIHLEGILGAFLAGLAVNTAVRSSPAKNKLQFLGNALFTPAFFIVTGFLIDLRMFFTTLVTNAPIVLALVTGLVGAKWLAAEIVGQVWGFGFAV